MSQDEQDLAKEHAARAARQARHAAKNVGEAAAHEKDHIAENIKEAAKPISPGGLMSVMGELGTGAIALTGAVILGTAAAQRFRAAYEMRSRMVTR
jgi:hypothetical protein